MPSSTKTCDVCGTQFSSGGRKRCSVECSHKALLARVADSNKRHRAANPDYARNYGLRYRGEPSQRIPLPDWRARFQSQNGLCWLCGQPMAESDAVLDHDHECCQHGCVICWRGLAHSSCNTVIGFAAENPERLRVIAANLERWQTAEYWPRILSEFENAFD
jgi:Recombination endonuclease VII